MGILSKWVESLDYEYQILTSCTRHRSPHSTCKKCLDICDVGAITLINQKPVISKDKCIECGKCLSACPVQAIAGIFPKRAVSANKLLVTNEHIPTVKELLIFYKQGVKELMSKDIQSVEPWKQNIDQANSILQQLGEEPFTVTVGTIDKGEELYSRRELFSLWRKESQSFVKQVAPAKWRFNHQQLDLVKYYPDYQFAAVSINIDKCTLCHACEFLCEKKCLNITETSFSLTAQSCSSCQLCADICPEKAITVKEQISIAHDIHYPLYQKVCSACGKPFATLRENDEKCVECTKLEGYLSPH